jgi:hypothetical protein
MWLGISTIARQNRVYGQRSQPGVGQYRSLMPLTIGSSETRVTRSHRIRASSVPSIRPSVYIASHRVTVA